MKAVFQHHRTLLDFAMNFHKCAEWERARKRNTEVRDEKFVSLSRSTAVAFQQATKLILATNLG
jgi:hypothetical protein